MMSEIEQCKNKIKGGVAHIDKAEENLGQTHESLDAVRGHLADAIGSLSLAFTKLQEASTGFQGTSDELDKAKELFASVMPVSYAAGNTIYARSLAEMTTNAIAKVGDLRTPVLGLMSMVGDGSHDLPGTIGVLDELVHRRDVLAGEIGNFAQEAPREMRSLAESWSDSI